MKNRFIYLFKSKLKLKIEGKNLKRFIHKLAHNNINILNIVHFKRDTIYVKIYRTDYEKLMSLKSIYNVSVIDAYGMIKVRKLLKVNRFIMYGLILGISLLIFLSNIIFKVEVIHTSKDIRDFLKNELRNYGIEKYNMKKSFDDIKKIKNEIINKYPDKIEWLEIEEVGTKYVVRVELREVIDNKVDNKKNNVVAKKDAIIRSIDAKSGMIIKNTNDYVKKGDVIISGNITLNDSLKGTINADGIIYGEVWYTIKVEYPFNYYEERETGKIQNTLSVKIFSNNIDLFSKFKEKKRNSKILIKNNLFPLSISFGKHKELKVIDNVLTEDEAIEQALSLAKNKINEKLNQNEYIIKDSILKVNVKESKVELDVFFAVFENITDYSEIVLEELTE